MRRIFEIDEKIFSTTVNGDEIAINGEATASVERTKREKLTVTLDGATKEVWVLGRKGNTYIIGVDGKEVSVEVSDTFSELRERMGFQSQVENQQQEVLSPMPGKIVEIIANAGDEVEEGSPLFILEAMKMENIVKSSTKGIISEVLRSAGETVQKNDVVIRF